MLDHIHTHCRLLHSDRATLLPGGESPGKQTLPENFIKCGIMPKWPTDGAASLGLCDCWKRSKVPNRLVKHSFPVMETPLLFPSSLEMKRRGEIDLQMVQQYNSASSAEPCFYISMQAKRLKSMNCFQDWTKLKVCQTMRFQSIIKREKMSFLLKDWSLELPICSM